MSVAHSLAVMRKMCSTPFDSRYLVGLRFYRTGRGFRDANSRTSELSTQRFCERTHEVFRCSVDSRVGHCGIPSARPNVKYCPMPLANHARQEIVGQPKHCEHVDRDDLLNSVPR